MGNYSNAIRWYGRGFKVADRLPDEAARTKARIELGVVFAEARFRQGEFRDCIRRCKAIVEEALPIADMKSLANAYLYLHVVHALLGSPERVAFRGLALPLFEELGDLRGQATALNNLGIEAYYEGDWDKALDVYERSRALFERIGDVTSVAMANNNIGEIRSDQGELEEAQTLFEEVERACDAAGHRALSTVAHSNLGRVAARAGRVDEAEALLQEALEAFREIHATSFVLETEARLAEVAALRGDRPQEALSRAESVLEHTEDAADMPSLHAAALRLRAAARLQLGDRVGAEEDLEESLRAARAGDSLYELALALDLSAAVSGDDDAAGESAALLQQLAVKNVARPPLPMG
jgi:tetratricopeptide (TPR) repeat protein